MRQAISASKIKFNDEKEFNGLEDNMILGNTAIADSDENIKSGSLTLDSNH